MKKLLERVEILVNKRNEIVSKYGEQCYNLKVNGEGL